MFDAGIRLRSKLRPTGQIFPLKYGNRTFLIPSVFAALPTTLSELRRDKTTGQDARRVSLQSEQLQPDYVVP